jgi:hypothetical protein
MRTLSMKALFSLSANAIVLAAILGLIGGAASASDRHKGKGRALVVGTAEGIVYEAIADHYRVTFGTGNEDPREYDLVVFDGNHTAPDALHKNRAPAHFLAAGKAVVLLNNTEDHRQIGLRHLLWAHAQGDSPAVAFFIPRDRRGVPRMLVQVDFPAELNPSGTFAPPTADQIAQAAQHWLENLRSRMDLGAPPLGSRAGDTGGNINPPSNGDGQTALTLDEVQSYIVSPLYSQWWPNLGSESNILWCSVSVTCYPQVPAPVVQTAPSVDAEQMLSVLLEQNGSGYVDKIIARQYSLMGPNIKSSTEYMLCNGSNATCNVYSLLGFNAAAAFQLLPSFGGAPLTVTEAMPEAENNTTNLTTSTSHSETVGLSGSAGFDSSGPTGSIGSDWSESWEWGQSTSINIQDWSSENSVGGPNVTYTFKATGGTPDTYSNLALYVFPNSDCNQCLLPTPVSEDNLNALQRSGMTSQSETEWQTNAPIPPGVYSLQANALFYFGEAYTFVNKSTKTPPSYGSPNEASAQTTFSLDFTNPTLQPPAAAPWTLSFGPYSSSPLGNDYVQTTGTVTLSPPPTSATEINLSYVIQPQQSLQTLPSPQVCPGNTSSFIPSNSVVNNGSPPLTITIPAGQTSASFPLTLETFNSSTYNIQVVAWQSTGNKQAAWCLTPPNK